jgi:shikimate dehydrogenase
VEQAEQIREQFMGFRDQISVVQWNTRSEFIADSTLIVNATPIGMHPHSTISPWPLGYPFPKEAIVYDLVYNPVETRLIKEAKEAGLKAVGGLGMLVEQAALSFQCWTGLPAPREVMMEAAYG